MLNIDNKKITPNDLAQVVASKLLWTFDSPRWGIVSVVDEIVDQDFSDDSDTYRKPSNHYKDATPKEVEEVMEALESIKTKLRNCLKEEALREFGYLPKGVA